VIAGEGRVRLATVWLRNSRLAGFVSGIAVTAIGLVIGAVLLPGTTIDWRGLLIAVAVIDLPPTGIDWYLRRNSEMHGHPQHLGRWGLGFLLLTGWVLGGLAVADWITPHFDIGGVWQYAVLWLVIFCLGFAYWKIVTTVVPDSDLD
jgi:hypothetical protein